MRTEGRGAERESDRWQECPAQHLCLHDEVIGAQDSWVGREGNDTVDHIERCI